VKDFNKCKVCGEVVASVIAIETGEIMKEFEYCSDACEEADYNPLGKDYTSAQKRKETPVYSGVLKYFPLALMEIARCSKAGNDQHNPGKELHWDRSKSGDELDALTRHLLQAGEVDTDGILHSTKVAWRALANLQKELEENGKA